MLAGLFFFLIEAQVPGSKFLFDHETGVKTKSAAEPVPLSKTSCCRAQY